ncbi:MAG: ATP-binding cassette domain-containing protein, partial [Planctomycetota bacterium]
MSLLEVRNLTVRFGGLTAVRGVNFTVEPGWIFSLIGPNGAGKTTLLRLLVGLLSPSDGVVSVLGRDPRRTPAVYRSLALVPEEDAVYGFQTARQFVAY